MVHQNEPEEETFDTEAHLRQAERKASGSVVPLMLLVFVLALIDGWLLLGGYRFLFLVVLWAIVAVIIWYARTCLVTFLVIAIGLIVTFVYVLIAYQSL